MRKWQMPHRNINLLIAIKKAQLPGFIQNEKIVEQKNTHQQVDLAFQPLSDGITFKLIPTFLNKVPAAHPRTAEWTGLAAGSSIGHAATNRIVINRIAGPFKKLNDSTFQISFEKGLNDLAKGYQCGLLLSIRVMQISNRQYNKLKWIYR
jgi:hypothetical protein